MKAEDQFHIGIVVEDVEATLAEFSAAFGYEWCDEMGGTFPVVLPTGETVLELRCVYSKTTPRLEIVRPIPGTFWQPAPGGGIHHVGYWSDDVTADSDKLVGLGFTLEATRTTEDGVVSFAFLRNPAGLLVELVNRASQPGLEYVWAHGSIPS